MARAHITDGLSKWQRHRLKDLPTYRSGKAAYAKTDAQREYRRNYMRMWREKNRARHNESARLSYLRHRDKRNKAARLAHLKRSYGMTAEDKAAMLASQNGLCKICGLPPKNDRMTHVDHCHRTGRVRGILCNSCNTRLGWYEKHGAAVAAYLIEPQDGLTAQKRMEGACA